MAKKKYTPEATVDLLYNQLMSDYKGDAQVEAERQRQKSAEKKASGNSTNSSTSVQNTLQSPSAVSRGASAVGNIYKAPKRKYTTGATTHGYTTGRSFAKDQTTKPSNKKQNAFERAGKTALGATQQFIGGHISSAGTALQGAEVTARSIHNQRAEEEQDYNLRSRREAEERERRIQDDLRKKEGIDTKDALKWRKSNFGAEVEASAKGYNRGRVYDDAKPVSLNSREEALKRANAGIEGTMSPEALGVKEGVYLKGTEKVYDRPLPKEYPEFDEYSPSQKVIGLGDRFIESGSKKIEEAKEGASRIGKLALDLEANAIQMLGDRTVAFVPVFGQALAMGSLMNRAGGTASYEARQEGMNPDQQYAYALGTSLVEGLSEGIFNSVSAFQSTYGKGMFSLADRVSTRVASSKIVAKVFKTETGRIVAYNLARLGAEGFEEGFEEVVADIVEPALKYAIKKGADPTVQFEGYDPKQIAYDYMVGSLMAGIPGSVETGRNIRTETSQAYRDGMAHADEVIARGLVQGREAVGNPTNSEILARQMQAQQESGLSILPGQTKQLQSEIAKDAYQNAQAFAEKAEEAESQANITPSTGTVTESVEVGTRSTALEKQSIEEAKQVMGAEASEKSAGAVGKVKAGTAKVQDHDTILADPKAREAVEEMTGITLPIKNTEARNILENLTLSNMIANRDTLRKEVQSDLAEKIAEERGQMNKRGGEMFAEHYDEALQGLQSFGSEAGMIYESVFTRLFADGTIRDANFEDSYDSIVAPLGSTVTSYFTEDFARQIFNEGRIKLESDLAKSVAKSKAISAERAGTVTYLHDTRSRLSSRQKETIEKFAQRTNVAIEFYDGKQEGQDDDSNGWYKDGVIHININSTRKLITVAKHELTHHIKATSPELYRKLEDFVFERWYHRDREMMEKAIRQKQMDYGDIDVIVAREEIIADASEAFFTDRGAINDVILFSKKLGMAIHDGIRTMLDSFLDVQDTDDLGYKGYGEFLKDLKILKDAQRMWLEALDQSVNRGRGRNASEATEADTEVRRSLKDIGMTLKDGNARWTDERIDYLIDEFGASNPDYSRAYAVLMNPRDFLKLTLSDEELNNWNERSAKVDPIYGDQRWLFRKLDTEELKNEKQTPFLEIYSKDGTMVQGHEGRHRMRALLEAGVKSVPVVIRDTDTKYTKKPLESMTLSSQDFGYDPVNNGAEITIKDLVPIKESNRAELIEKFGGEAEVRFSKKDDQDYLDAVNRGDMETAQRMVDEYAKKAGYDVKAYHGTSNFGFTKFSTRDNNGNRIETENGKVFGNGFYFTDNKDVAEKRYANVLSRSRLVDGEWVTEKTNRGVYNVYLNLGNNYVLDWNDTKGISQRDFDRLLRDIWKDHNSLTIKNVRDGIDITSTVYVVEMTPENAEQYWDTAWSSSRIKSADPVTYDDNGNVIPLSERFNDKNEDIRYSRKDDQAYLDAVNKGDLKTAQEMVDEQAKKAGYDSPKVYHGTPHFGFTQFKDNAHEVPFIYTSTNRTVSAHYAGDNNYAFPRPIGKAYRRGTSIADIIDNAKTIYGTEYKVMSRSQKRSRYNDIRNQAIEVADKLDDFYVKGSWDYETDNAIARVADLFFTIRDGEGEYDFSNYDQNNSLKNRLNNMVNAYKDSREIVKQYYDENRDSLSSGEKKYLSYLLGYDIGDVAIDIEYGMLRLMSNEDLLISDLGNVSVPSELKDAMDQIHEIGSYELFGNVGDNPFEFDANGGQFWALKVPQMGDGYYDTDSVSKWALENGYTSVIMHNIYDYGDKADNYVFFNSSQLKSADPVTYDDNGNVIPLSERFNDKNEDIRYSHKTEHEPLPKARTIPQKIKNVLKKIGADKLGIKSLKAPVQISVRDLRTLWYDLNGSQEGERLNAVLEEVGNELQRLAGKYTYVSLADALEGTIHYRVDENGKPTSIVLSCKVQNAEYDINFDFTTICAKRAPLQKVLERFIKTEGKKNGESLYDELRLDEEGLYTLRAIMEQEGFDVSCIGCFVEQNRYAQQIQSKTVADDWNKAIDEYEKEHGIKITEGFDFQNLDINSLPYNEIQQGFRRYSALMKGKPTTVENKNRALIEAIPYLRKRLSPSDYASIAGQKGMMAMGNGKTNLYNLLKRGQGDSKQSTPFVPYNGEVALLPETKKGKPMFDYLFGIGGARAQSASDFQIEYVFDYMQLVGDLAGRGLPMHMYTKVIECAELLGKCGIKINLSAMCDVDNSVDSEYAGLKKVNGKWVYNISDQSIDYNKAVKLQRQDGYSKNIGIIMVVLSKQHMLKALGDADVRYIIGYHSSKMPAVVAKASNMGNATDYTKLNKTNKLNERGQALFDKAMRMAKGDTDLARYKDALRIFDDLIQQDKTNDANVRRGNEYTRYMSSFKTNTADFDVYNDIKKTNDPRATADNYIRYCMANDLVPMYFPFAFHENYYKCEVYDYNVYDNVSGEYAPMGAVQNVYPDLNIAEGETDSKKFMARVSKMLKAQNEKNKALEPKYERVERRAIAELSITGNDYMDMDASGIDHAELEHRVDMTEEAVEERRRSIKEKELNAKTIEYQSTIRKLEKNVEGLKAQFKRTNKKPNPVEARRQAGRLIQRHASNMSIHEDVTNTLTEIYEMYAKRGAKAFDDIYAIAERTAVEIVNNISEVHFEGQEEYNQIKDYLRDTDIVVSEEMKRNITDFNDFRKSHFGKLKLVNGERSNIDSVYAELSEMFPSQFTDEYVNPADQLNHIADVFDSYAPFYETLDGTSEEMQDYVVEVASDLMETAYNLQNKKTFADKKYDEKVKAVKKAREKALANKKEALSKLRDKYNRRMAEAVRMAETETRAETEFNIYEKAEKKRRIAQIAKIHKRLTEKLLTPSDTKHLPDGYNKIVAEVLGMFDFTTRGMVRWVGRYAVPSERMTAMLNLRRALQEYTTNEEESEIEIDKDMVDVVDILEGAFGEDIKVSDLNLETLENVVVMLRGFEHQINSYNRAFDENNKQRISDLADKVVDEASKVKHGKWRAGIMGRVFTSNLNPWDFFQMIGGEVGSLYEATRKGFDKYENNLRVAKNFMADLIGSKQYDKWANHTKTYKTTSGEEITLTDTQLMSLYCLSKREQAQGHIYGQGVVSAPVKVKRNMIAEKLDKKRVIPTFDDVVDWTKNLSKEQIEVADKIQNFLSNEVSEWGNETSLKLYGYKKFTEKDYFPIQSSNDYLNSNFDAKGSDPTLKNISPTKAVVKGANNPLMLDDIFSIFSKHVAQMASYNGFVPAITDFQRVWNHKMVSADGRKTTVKETFGEAYGDRIAKYVEQFYADLNGVYKRNLDVTTPEKLFGTFKKSAVGGNLRVLAQQPMAIARAMLLVDPALLTVSVPKTALQAKRTYQEMLEHCPIAEWKVWGFYSPDVMGASRDLKNVMLGKDSISDKVFMNMYGVADNITWTVIFNACKMQVERQNKGIAKGSQEYWDKVNDLASDVYDATQVVDSPFHRSELMKSQDGIHKMATAFMAEPTKTINMINTQLTLCAREISEGKVGKATLRFTRLTGTVLANAMLLAVGQSLIDAMRSAGGGDDDDDKGDFEERFKKHWVTNTKDNLNLLKMLPYVKDAVSIYEGFGVTRMDMNGVEKTVKATQALKKYYDDPGSAKYTELELWNNTAMAFAYTLGVPISNAKRDLDALALTVAESVKDPKVMLWYMRNKYQVNSKTKSIWADAYYDALDKGNTGLAKSIYAYMKKSGVDDKYIQNREKTWEKHRYGETDEE